MPVTPGVTITGTMEDLTGTANAGKLVWTLVNFGDFLPEISGTMVLAELSVTTQAASNGTFSQTLWGNYQLSPSNTFYQLAVIGADGTQVIVAAFQFNTAGSFDLSTLVPISGSTPPIFIPTAVTSFNGRTGVVVPATGDYSFSQISGTLTSAQEPSTTVNAVVSDTNITGSISAQTLTLGWTGTLAAGRLNSNVVQSVTNDTNITGSISGQNLTLGWTGTLSLTRGGTGANLSATGGTSQVLKQTSAGAAITVGQLAFSDISGTISSSQLAGNQYVVTSKSANYTANSYDDVWCNGTFTVTLPAVGTGVRVKISNRGTGQITVSPQSGTILGNSSMILGTQYSSVELSSDGTNWTVE